MKKLLITLFLISVFPMTGQTISPSISQDAKLLTFGDSKRGYEAPTAVTPNMVNAFNKAAMYVQSNIEDKRFYKPFRFIFHPLIMVALSILFTLIFI